MGRARLRRRVRRLVRRARTIQCAETRLAWQLGIFHLRSVADCVSRAWLMHTVTRLFASPQVTRLRRRTRTSSWRLSPRRGGAQLALRGPNPPLGRLLWAGRRLGSGAGAGKAPAWGRRASAVVGVPHPVQQCGLCPLQARQCLSPPPPLPLPPLLPQPPQRPPPQLPSAHPPPPLVPRRVLSPRLSQCPRSLRGRRLRTSSGQRRGAASARRSGGGCSTGRSTPLRRRGHGKSQPTLPRRPASWRSRLRGRRRRSCTGWARVATGHSQRRAEAEHALPGIQKCSEYRGRNSRAQLHFPSHRQIAVLAGTTPGPKKTEKAAWPAVVGDLAGQADAEGGGAVVPPTLPGKNSTRPRSGITTERTGRRGSTTRC